MPLLDALRALTSFDPPSALPPCDLAELAEVLDAHGLAPLASYQVENRPIGAGLPGWFRERLLAVYQGVVNDNVFKLVALRDAARHLDVPAVLLGGAAYVDWLYPHLAFRPVGDLRLAVRGVDGARFAECVAGAGFRSVSVGPGRHTALFHDGRIELRIQEGLVEGRPEPLALFERCVPFPALGKTISRPSAADAVLATVADLALLGLDGPLFLYVDLRELLLSPEIAAASDELRVQARRLGLERALFGACALVSHFFPRVADRAAAQSPALGRVATAAVEALIEGLRDPTRLRRVRGVDAVARRVVAP